MREREREREREIVELFESSISTLFKVVNTTINKCHRKI
jgi:hypothetical protein